MRFLKIAFILVSTFVMAQAACVCKCVNGNVEVICENSYDLKPVCAPQVCPITPPSVAPIQAPVVPPVGTSSCSKEQVYNERTFSYKWQTICR